jgi:PKD repeat protein
VEERNLKGKIIVLLVSMAVLVGILSGCTEETQTPANNAPVVSVADPVIEHNTSLAGGTVNFNSTATDADGDDLTYLWDFGDDVGSSTEADPEYAYAENGTYTVILTVSDGTDTATWTDDVVVGNVEPTAGFTYEPGLTNFSMNFTDASTDPNTGDTLTYLWDFGDDTTNTTQNPVHEYAAAGNYTVILTVTDSYGLADNETATVEVTE